MEFFEAVETRRSVRKFTQKPVPDAVMNKALDAALLAPNSSNMQTWQFYWVRNPEKKSALVKACVSQGAARTAQEIIVAVVDRKVWKKMRDKMLEHFRAANAPQMVFDYYGKLIPFLYGWTWFAPFKYLIMNAIGLFKPISRRPWSVRDIDEVCIKSSALACENLMLAIRAQGFDSCPMEGFDECRVKKILNLSWSSRVVMCIGIGERDPEGIWGEQLRFQRDWFIKIV